MTRQLSTEESDRLLVRIPAWLAGTIGALASVLTLLAIFGFLYLILAASGVFQLLGEWARQSVEGQSAYGMGLWRSLSIILLQSTLNIVVSLWSVRWAFLGFAVLGCLVALVTRRVARLSSRLGGTASFLCFFLPLLYAIVCGAFYLGGGAEAFVDLGVSSLGQLILASPATALFVGAAFGLLLTALLWEIWRLSYAAVLGRTLSLLPSLESAPQPRVRPAADSPEAIDELRQYTSHIRELKRDEETLRQARWRRRGPGQEQVVPEFELAETDDTYAATSSASAIAALSDESVAERIVGPLSRATLVAVVVLPLCLLGIRLLHPYQAERAAHSKQYWNIHLSPTEQDSSGSIKIVYLPRTLTIAKLTGGVIANAEITGPAPSKDQVWSMEDWDLREHPFTREYSIAHLEPGDYRLTFYFKGSIPGYEDARLGYTYTQGGGPVAQRLGLAEGLMVSTAFVAGATLVAAGLVHLYIFLRRSRGFDV